MGHVNAELGQDCQIHDDVVVGLAYRENCQPAIIGDHAVIRMGSIIYGDVVIGHHFKTGHHVVIREQTRIGDRVVVGTHTVIDGHVEIGSYVKLESQVYIPTHTTIGSEVFVGPGAVLTNDRYPQRLRAQYEPEGPILADSVTVGAQATILPGVRIGEGAMVAAGSIVTHDVPAWHLAIGVPAEIRPLPEKLQERNRAKSW